MLVVELFSVRYALYALGLLVGGVVLVAGFLFALEFDLLGVMILTTYSSVFILLALLVVQFAPLNGPAGRARLEGLGRQNWLWGLAVVGAWGLVGLQPGGGDWVGGILWQDLLGAGGEELAMASSLVHELLYRVFVWEVL